MSWNSEKTLSIRDLNEDYSLDESVIDQAPSVVKCPHKETHENQANNDYFDYIDSIVPMESMTSWNL